MPHREYHNGDMEEEEGGEPLAYDPDQDREERLKVRKGYRSLQNDGEASMTLDRALLLTF